MKKSRDIYPVTIIKSRYGGVYEGAKWVAFNAHSHSEILSQALGGDIPCSSFFAQMDNPRIDVKNLFDKKIFVGRGKNPQDAYDDLVKKVIK